MVLSNYQKVGNVVFKDRLKHLKELIKSSLINLPYHNTTTLGIFLPRERKVPTYEELFRVFQKGEGGFCSHLNVPFRHMLESHGFETQLVSGNFLRNLNGYPITHFMMTVKIPDVSDDKVNTTSGDVRRDKTYLVDIAGACPLHEPVDLDELPFVRRAGGLQYRIERVSDTILQRVNENGDTLVGEKPPTFISPQNCRIDLTPRQFSEFLPALQASYYRPKVHFMHRGLFCFRYRDITDDDFEIVVACGTSLTFITKETRSVQNFGNYEEMKPIVIKNFPMINPDDIELSMKHFSIPLEEALKMSSSKEIVAFN